MTSKNYAKVRNQLEQKPAKWKKYIKHNKPKDRKSGKGVTRCELCNNPRGHISKYGLNICRICFRFNASKMGFRKLD